MNKFSRMFALALIGLALAQADEMPAKLTLVVGDVEVTRNGVAFKAPLNYDLLMGDIVSTKAESYCEIKFSTQSLVRLESNSSMRIERKDVAKDRKVTRLFVMLGEIVAKIAKVGKRDVYEVKTNSAQAFVRGTIFKLKVDQDGSSLFSVFEGKLGVQGLIKGAKELLMNQNFQGKITVGQLAPAVQKISPQELQKFQQTFKGFLDRSAEFEKALKDLEKNMGKNQYYQKAKKGCLF